MKWNKKSDQIRERLKNRKNPFFENIIEVGDYVVCVDDIGDKSYDVLVPATKKEKEFYGSFVNSFTGEKVTPRDYKWEKCYKLKSITFNKLYEVFDMKKLKSIKIKGDDGKVIWITSTRFDFDPEMNINQKRYATLKNILI